MAMTAAQMDRAFQTLERVAILGERCPINAAHGGPTEITSEALRGLALDGRIEIEISGHNYRTVTILKGPHEGKKTAPNPSGSRAYKVLNQHGTFLNGERCV